MPFQLSPVTDAESRFKREFVEFAKLWAEVKEQWLDERARRFEKENLSSLGPSLNRFTAALQEFADNVRKADNALSDDHQVSDDLY